MPCITRCCCCDLRGGSVTTSFYSMVYASIALGLSAFKIHVDVKAARLSQEESAFFIATCVDLIFFSLLFVFSILLLYGVKNAKRYLFIPYLVCMVILVVLQAVLLILLAIILVTTASTGVVMELLIIGLLTFINVYCVLCVVSYYQDLRDGRAGMRAIYRAHGTTLPHIEVPPQPEKCGDLNSLENANFVPTYPGPPGTGAMPYPNHPGGAMGMAYPPNAELDAPPPYQPPEYPAQMYPKAEVQTA